jgi:glycosyltransferase involved in cell wall biosynthesis
VIKVFVSYNWFTPAYKAGGPIQSLDSMVKHLGDTFNFCVFCSDRDHDRSQLKVQPNTWVSYVNSEVFYASKNFLKIFNVGKLIKEKQPTVIFINGLYSWYFNIIPLIRSKDIRKIVSVRGMLHPGALSQKPFKKKIYLTLWKLLKFHKKCEFHATTVEEKQYIEQVFGREVTTWVAGNLPKVLDYHSPPQKAKGTLVLVSIALISPMKNHLLVLESLRNVASLIEYNIYGPIKDQGYWRQCEAIIKILPSNVRVKYKGEVLPDSISDKLLDNHVFILPSKSENFGHAIYEALSVGKPVITSHNTPWNNLEVLKSGINVELQSHQELTNAIEFFASMNNEEFVNWSRCAKSYASKTVNIDVVHEQYKTMFEDRKCL